MPSDESSFGHLSRRPPSVPEDDETNTDTDAGQVRIDVDGAVLLIAFDRPFKRNALTLPMLSALAAAFTQLEDDADLRCGVLYAIGSPFCAGLDLPAVLPLLRQGVPLFPPGSVEPTSLGSAGMRQRSKPLVAAVTGAVAGFGCDLMLAADIVVAADDSRFAPSTVAQGLPPMGGGAARLAARAGAGHAALHLLAGTDFTADDALRWNLVHKLVRGVHAFDAACRIAQTIARQPAEAVAATRALILGVQSDAATLVETAQGLRQACDIRATDDSENTKN